MSEQSSTREDRPQRRGVVQRSSRQGVRFSYRLSVLCAKIASWIVWALGGRGRRLLASLGATVFLRASSGYRENVESNLRQVLGEDVDPARLAAATRSVFHTSARNFVDLLLSPRLSREEIKVAVHLSKADRAILDAAVAEGRGVVILSAHLGAFDFIGQGLDIHGYSMTVATARTTSRFIFDGVTFLRGTHGMALVDAATPAGVRRTVQALRQGRCAAILADRDFLHNGRPVHFFGRETTLPVGAIRIARDTGAPIVPVLTRRVGDGHQLTVYPAMHVPQTGDADADIRTGLAMIIPVLEDAIGRSPEQWVMFQRVWPEAPVDPVRAFPVGSPFAAGSGPGRGDGWRGRLRRLARRPSGD